MSPWCRAILFLRQRICRPLGTKIKLRNCMKNWKTQLFIHSFIFFYFSFEWLCNCFYIFRLNELFQNHNYIFDYWQSIEFNHSRFLITDQFSEIWILSNFVFNRKHSQAIKHWFRNGRSNIRFYQFKFRKTSFPTSYCNRIIRNAIHASGNSSWILWCSMNLRWKWRW